MTDDDIKRALGLIATSRDAHHRHNDLGCIDCAIYRCALEAFHEVGVDISRYEAEHIRAEDLAMRLEHAQRRIAALEVVATYADHGPTCQLDTVNVLSFGNAPASLSLRCDCGLNAARDAARP